MELNWTVYNTSNSGLPDNHAINVDSHRYDKGTNGLEHGMEGLLKFDGITLDCL
jgi:hypothetical protein